MIHNNIPPKSTTIQLTQSGVGQKQKPRASLNDNNIKLRAASEGFYLDSEWSAPLEHIITMQLPTPSNVRIVDGVLTWSAVPNAVGYEVRINGETYEIKEGTTQSLQSLSPGQYSVAVRAMGNEIYLTSEWSANVDYTSTMQLDTPINLVVSNGVLTWDEVEHATQYDVEVDGTVVDTVNVSRYDISDLGAGVHTFRVKALGDGNMVFKISPLQHSVI
ncbi:MAG: hypothetical protein FWF56_06225 [Firmicutes bacterium]|nr:hypothetical protein [Bacillota bacterium]MCL1953380.1 hypothetical protein [Bacillota bacterium]